MPDPIESFRETVGAIPAGTRILVVRHPEFADETINAFMRATSAASRRLADPAFVEVVARLALDIEEGDGPGTIVDPSDEAIAPYRPLALAIINLIVAPITHEAENG